MLLSLELTARQAERVLEHARRSAARLELAPRSLPDSVRLRGALQGREGAMLVVDLDNAGAGVDVLALIGACCDVQMQLEGDLYQFSAAIMDIPDHGPAGRLLVSLPESIQVVNRRRWERTKAHVLAPARVFNPADGVELVGHLVDVSAGGLGVHLPGLIGDQELYVGDPVVVRFELPEVTPPFELPGVVCGKLAHPGEQHFVLSVEFATEPGPAAAERDLERLRAALFEMTIDLSQADGRPCDPDES
jgi:hypothetical protein